MDISTTKNIPFYDREKELEAFNESETCVKGLVDAGVAKVPKIFITQPDEHLVETNSDLEVPVIDLLDIQDRRGEIICEVGLAAEKWGFFQVVNHGIPSSVLEEMIDKTRRFHEQDDEVKKAFYSRDYRRSVRYQSNYHLYQSHAATWRDSLTISMFLSDQLEPDEIPLVCRAAAIEYFEHVAKLGASLNELLSEALGLTREHLKSLQCDKGCTLIGHYYPACPEPELTLGAGRHTDPSFLTILLQDQLGGLQILHEKRWVNVKPVSGGLVVNIGDLLQIISNDKFKSVVHRVTANRIGPRISVASLFSGVNDPLKLYGPIKELVSEDYPPLYREFLAMDYISKFFSLSPNEYRLDHFKL